MKKINNPNGAKWNYGEEIPGDWHVYKGMCPDCGTATFDYGAGWRCMAMYCNKNANNPAPNVGPEPLWWFEPIKLFKDGNMWCAVYNDFIDPMESPQGFGETPQKAVTELKQQGGPTDGK